MLTGRYPLRFDIRNYFREKDEYLPEDAITLPELLQNAGYRTAHVGKWHLGGLLVNDNGKHKTNYPGPGQHGFSYYQSRIEQSPVAENLSRDYRRGGTILMRNGKRIKELNPLYNRFYLR